MADITLDKYKIAVVAKGKDTLTNNVDPKTQMQKGEKVAVTENNSQDLTVEKMQTLIDSLPEPQKSQMQKELDEIKDMATKKANKDLNKKDVTPVNKEDELLKNYPPFKEPGETKEINPLDYPVAAAQKNDILMWLKQAEDSIKEATKDKPIKKELDDKLTEALNSIKTAVDNMTYIADNGHITAEDLRSHTLMRINNIIGPDKSFADLDPDVAMEAIKKFASRARRITSPEKMEMFKTILKERGFEDLANTLQIPVEASEWKSASTLPAADPTKLPIITDPNALPQQDIFDVAEGLPLGNGFMAHKDDKTGEIYVLDKEGKEQVRVINAFVNDMALVIEFFRKLLMLPDEGTVQSAATDDSGAESYSTEMQIPKMKSDEDKKNEEEKAAKEARTEVKDEIPKEGEQPAKEETSDAERAVDELLNKTEESKGAPKEEIKEGDEQIEEESLPDVTNEKLAELADQIHKKEKVTTSIVNYMIEHDKVPVTNDEVKAQRIAGESIIYARQRAQANQVAKLTEELMKSRLSALELIEASIVENNTEQTDHYINKLFRSAK